MKMQPEEGQTRTKFENE